MEYLDGVDLEQLLAREGSLPIERALLIAAQVCRALIAAHAAGIIHRDLKPANVMLVRHRDEEDFVKVLDFGISKQSDLDRDARGKEVGLTRPDAAVGTPIYMAPEQVAGQPADGRTDVYAVGELLFEMLTGVPPCSGSDIIAVFNKKANENPVAVRSLRPEVPVRIESLLARAMSRAPGDRHPSMTALKDDIMSGLTAIDEAPVPPGTPAIAGPGLSTAHARGWRPPARAVWLTAGGVVAGLGLASMAALWRGGPPWDAPRSSPPLAEPTLPQRSTSEANSLALHERPSLDGTALVRPPVVGVNASSLAPGPAPGPGPANTNTVIRLPIHLPVLRATTAAPAASAAHSASRRAAATSKRPTAARASAGVASTIPNAPSDDLVRGRAAFAKGNFPDAVRLGRAALTSGDAVGAHLLLGDAFYKMDRFRDALGEYDAVLKTAPTNPQAQRGRELALRRAHP
jgi:serine/threonine protein kinase